MEKMDEDLNQHLEKREFFPPVTISSFTIEQRALMLKFAQLE